VLDVEDDECFQRVGLGTPDVQASVVALRQRGMEFIASKDPAQDSKGAITRPTMGNAMFELVHHVRG
jgi:4-hydroxyphenylpyruvate dioxygenase